MKKILTILAILSLFILAACSNTQQPAGSDTGIGSAETGTSDSSFAGTLADAMKLGKTFKCTMSVEGNTVEYYVKGNKFRSEATVQGMKSIAIMDSNKCLWMWQEGNTQGSKMCVTGESSQASVSAPSQAQTKTDIRVNCAPSVISDDKFTPPSSVQFSDLDEMMKQAQANMPSSMPEVPEIPGY